MIIPLMMPYSTHQSVSGSVSHTHSHTHKHAGHIEHSFREGSGQELRGVPVTTEDAIKMAQSVVEAYEKHFTQRNVEALSEKRNAIYNIRYDWEKGSEAREEKEFDKETDALRDKRAALQSQIVSLKSEGRRWWGVYTRQKEIDDLDQEIQSLQFRIDKQMDMKERRRADKDDNYYRSLYLVHRLSSFSVEKTKHQADAESMYSTAKEILVVATVTSSKEVLLSQSHIDLLYTTKSRDIGEVMEYHYKMEVESVDKLLAYEKEKTNEQ